MLRRFCKPGVMTVARAELADAIAGTTFPAGGPDDVASSKVLFSDSDDEPPSHAKNIRMRQIGPEDMSAVADVLHHGFPNKSRGYFVEALYRLSVREPPKGTPQFGFLLEARTKVVGALLTIFSFSDGGEHPPVRCNVACWHVLPQFRVYASLLVLQVGRNPSVTYTNISAASGTWQTIEAQGFRRFSTGAFAGVPALSPRCHHVKVSGISLSTEGMGALAPHELKILRDHEQFGCTSLVCVSAEGVHPFVFRRRRVSRFPLPCAQLIYCRDLKDLSRFAGPIGRFLAMRGMTWMLVATSLPIEKMVGKYFQDRLPMYFKGPACPATGDLAYTEAALFGF
jgi:hypothetical protein